MTSVTFTWGAVYEPDWPADDSQFAWQHRLNWVDENNNAEGLPTTAGIYVLTDIRGQNDVRVPIYVGQTGNLLNRFRLRQTVFGDFDLNPTDAIPNFRVYVATIHPGWRWMREDMEWWLMRCLHNFELQQKEPYLQNRDKKMGTYTVGKGGLTVTFVNAPAAITARLPATPITWPANAQI